jgi:hypothetical protein
MAEEVVVNNWLSKIKSVWKVYWLKQTISCVNTRYTQAFRCDENLRICFNMERGIHQLMFYLVRSTMVPRPRYHGRDLCVDLWILLPTYTRKFATQILTCSRQSPTNVKITPIDAEQQGNYLRSVLLKCPEAFIFQDEVRSRRGISERSDISYSAAQTSAFRSRSKGPMLIPIDCCHSW